MPLQNLTSRIDAIRNTGEVIAQTLKEMIHEAELKPGQPLVQENIAKMFGVSRVPVRDALQLLINMGIAVSVPRRGVIVRPLSRKLLEELFEVRKVLEGAAITKAVRRATPELIHALNRHIDEQAIALKTADVKRNEKVDDEFHRALYISIDNSTMNELIFNNWERIKQARCSSTVDPNHGTQWISASMERHQKVVEALEKKDETLAYRVIVENIESSRQEITSSLEEMGWID